MESNADSVILINKFNIKPDEVNRFLKDWAEDATYFKQQPGFIGIDDYADDRKFKCTLIAI